ncbi:MAG: L,D-transpeptidase [Ignavibacteriales bacterium]
MKLIRKRHISTRGDELPSIIIEVKKRRLHFRSKTLNKTYPVAVGKPSTPTPLGNWSIVQKAMNPGGAFGARWMRLSAPQGGYGIHGTNNPKSIGRAVSHGCVRMYNKDVIEIYPLTPIGTPVTIVASMDFGLPANHTCRLRYKEATGRIQVLHVHDS